MSADMNNIIIIGRLVRDPEIRYTPSGVAVANLSIANGERIKQGNEWKDHTNYFDVVVWGNQAVNCEKYLKKGSQIAVNGSLKQNRWTDNQTQQSRSKVSISARSIQFLTTSSKTAGITGNNSPVDEGTYVPSGDGPGKMLFENNPQNNEDIPPLEFEGGEYDPWSNDDIPF